MERSSDTNLVDEPLPFARRRRICVAKQATVSNLPHFTLTVSGMPVTLAGPGRQKQVPDKTEISS